MKKIICRAALMLALCLPVCALAATEPNAKTIEDFFVLGHIMTAMPPIHAIPAVVAAAQGIATYNDLPLPNARGVTPAGRRA